MLEALKRNFRHLALLIGLLVMSVLMLRDYTSDSPTEDELTHMVRGIAYWRGGDTRLSYAHPPLGNAWTALPVAWDADNPRIDRLKGWSNATAASTTKAYAEYDYAHARAQLMRSRLAVMAIGLLLVSYVYYWCISFFGLRTALAALLLICLNPVLLAQCRYVTTDPPAMLGFTIGIGELLRYLRGDRFGLVRMALGVSLGLLTKYSGVTLVPVVVVAALACCWLGKGIFSGQPGKLRFVRLGKHLALTGVIVTLCINLAYRFEGTGLTVGEILDRKEPTYWVSSKYPGLFERFTPLPKLPRALPIPLPYTYMFGIAGIRAHSSGGFTSYFWGERLRKAPAIYYPVMLLIKNPPSTLLLLGAGAVLLARRRRASLASWVLAGGVAAFLAVASRSNLAMGVRHLLPVMPALSVLAGRSFDLLWEAFPQAAARQGLGALLASTAVSAFAASPDYLGYFNLLAGGREGGHRISIYGEDWGQDRERLAELVKRRRLSPLYYDPQTPLRAQEASFLGLKYKPLRCGMKIAGAWVAVHALTYKTRDADKCYPYLKGRAPDLDVRHHIYLWHVPAASAGNKPQEQAAGTEAEELKNENRSDTPPGEN